MPGSPDQLPSADVTVSVLTPTWNRRQLLPRVFAGLQAQIDPAFEWIVADDGSTDGTDELVAEFASVANFPISFIRADARVGKARMDNAAVRQAQGTLIVWCDSDDHFLPDTIAALRAAWASIPAEERVHYSGVTALAATSEGVIVNPLPGISNCDIGWNDLTETRKIAADMVYMIRRDLLLQNPFPEVDLVIPESVVWSRLGEMKARYIGRSVKMVEYRSANAISFSGMMSYNRGRAYALAATGYQLRHYRRTLTTHCWRLITFIRYSIHGDIGLRQGRELWADNPLASLFWVFAPIARLLALRDVRRGKVVKSHVEFERNRNVEITARNPGATPAS